MARLYIAVNGDDVGSKIGDAIASNDHMALGEFSGALKESHGMIEQWIEGHGGQVITSSGDEGIYICPEECLQELEEVRQQYAQMCGHTLTVGVGSSMADASKALIYGKLNNKNQVVHYEPMIDDYLSDDQVEDAEMQEQQAGPEAMGDDRDGMVISDDQQKQTLNEDQMQTDEPTPMQDQQPDVPSNEDINDPNDMTENPDNEVGEVGDELEDDESVDEYEKLDPETAVDEVVQQEENKDITGEKEMPMQEEEAKDAIEGELDDMDSDNIEHDEEAGNEGEDELTDMVYQDMQDQEGDSTEEELAMEDEMPPEEGGELPMDEETAPQQDDHADIKAEIMNTLQMFKQHKPDLDMLATQNPELHEALITMLQHMIEMGRRMSEGPQDADDVSELNEFSEQFPDADHEDGDEDQEEIEEEMDEHNEEQHDEDPEEDSAISNDDSEEDATPEEDDQDEDADTEDQEDTDKDEEKLEKKPQGKL